MASTSEKGNAKNVANFQQLISFVTGYGAAYAPSKKELELPQLNTLLTASQAKLADVVSKKTSFNNAVNDRVAAFKDLKPLATRLVNALQTTDASKEKIADAKGYNKKLQGDKGKAPEAPEAPGDPNAPIPDSISSSQQSYDQQVQHFAGIISVLESESSYTPNETDLQVATLQAKQEDLSNKNKIIADAYTDVSNSRVSRDKTLYTSKINLFTVASEVKKYIKSVFGATSPEFAQVKGIEFTQKGT